MESHLQLHTLATVAVVPRDRFSVTAPTLRNLIRRTPAEVRILCVLAGAPRKFCENLKREFGKRVEFVESERFLNPAESRNLVLREIKTELAVLMDNDVTVLENWLEPLVRCQRETGAGIVVPLILDNGNKVHTAGNDFYVTHRDGKAYAHKVLRYYQMVVEDTNNLERCPSAYGELHCQIVKTREALEYGIYDEKILEVGECDSALTLRKHGGSIWFEPASMVYYDRPGPMQAMDIRYFCWRWDMRGVLKGYQYFEEKWGIDITEHGHFRTFLLAINNRLGLLPRLWPCSMTLWLDTQLKKLSRYYSMILLSPLVFWRKFKAARLGYNEWPVPAPRRKV